MTTTTRVGVIWVCPWECKEDVAVFLHGHGQTEGDNVVDDVAVTVTLSRMHLLHGQTPNWGIGGLHGE